MRVLTLNLHCFQQHDALGKLKIVARAIAENQIDAICLQEAAQHQDSPVIATVEGVEIKADNAAHLIVTELRESFGQDFNFVWDYAHLGWEVWEEGIAILSRYPISNFRSEWLSQSQDRTDWLSRKAVSAEVAIDGHTLRIISAHLGWWNDAQEPFDSQFQKLYSLAAENVTLPTIIGADFNVAAGSTGYEFMMSHSEVVDTYLDVNPDSMLVPTFEGNIDGWEHGDPKGMRIDYVLGLNLDSLTPTHARRMFDGVDEEIVSDHYGVCVDFSGSVQRGIGSTRFEYLGQWAHD
jgi:maltose 6'-phosphate phosphatase